ncbi:MAG: ribonuclease P protein component [Bacteroidia bacterium]|nr:ribonuclease P protein component [Bacteroidia bacterium]
MITNGFTKKERVHVESVITALFAKGNFSLYAPPFRFSWVILEPTSVACQILVVSSKKKLKSSVDRNRQKRQLRELYRLHKNELTEPLKQLKLSIALSVIYTGIESLQVVKHTPYFIKALHKIAIAIQKDHKLSIHSAH